MTKQYKMLYKIQMKCSFGSNGPQVVRSMLRVDLCMLLADTPATDHAHRLR